MNDQNMMKQVSVDTLSSQLSTIFPKLTDEEKVFFQDIVAIAHNNSIRTYELSCIMDGLLYTLRECLNVSPETINNYIQLATAIKEYKIQTNESLTMVQAIEKFLPEGYVIGSEMLRLDAYEYIAKAQKGETDNG